MTRDDLILNMPNNMVICEIGVFKGEFSEILLKTNPKKLHLIDIFEGSVCSGDKDGNNIIYTNLNEEYDILCKKYVKDDRIEIHKGFSSEILSEFEDGYFDMVYIDGDHSYEGVKTDLKMSYNKIKLGGFICGHDYTSNIFPGVVRAVDEFCKDKGLIIKSITNDGCPSYLIIKEK